MKYLFGVLVSLIVCFSNTASALSPVPDGISIYGSEVTLLNISGGGFRIELKRTDYHGNATIFKLSGTLTERAKDAIELAKELAAHNLTGKPHILVLYFDAVFEGATGVGSVNGTSGEVTNTYSSVNMRAVTLRQVSK